MVSYEIPFIFSWVIFHCISLAHDTEHDRIVRGAALGVALCLYRKEDEADPIIDQMARDNVSNH